MAMEHHVQEAVPQNSIIIKENEASLDKWSSSSEAIDESENSPSGGFDCNICLDSVQDPVVTLCGHLYCWPCIYKWIHRQNPSPENQEILNPRCPVCKTEISQKTMIPLYGRAETTKPFSGDKAVSGFLIPRRPPTPRCGVRTEAPAATTMTMNVINPTSPTTGMFGELVYERLFGSPQTTLFAYPHSYNLAGISTQRARRQAIQTDRSLSRVSFFLFCCIMLCLILF